jgi:uncharacterized Zn-binding protein involved in type VI secretion
MANIVLDNDMSTGHGTWPAVPIHASSSVTLNGKKLALSGDKYSSHTNSASVTHTMPPITGTSSVTVNTFKIILSGDPISCGDTATSSSTVSIT